MPLTNNFSEKEFNLISNIGREIISTLEINEVIERIYSNVNKLMNAPIFAVGIYDDIANTMNIWGIKDEDKIALIGNDLILDNRYWVAYCYNEQQEILINDYSTETYDKYFSNSLFKDSTNSRKSLIYVPLTINKKKLGILSVQAYEANAYDNKHFQIVKHLASYISVAIQNASNYQKIKKQNLEILLKSKKLEHAHETLEETVKQRTNVVEKQKEKLETINKELTRLSIVACQTENAIMIMDAQGYILWINDFFTKLYEYSYDQFTAMRGKHLKNTSFNPEINNILTKCITQKKAIEYSALNITVSGRKIWTQTTLTPILDNDGNIEHLVTIDTDITKRKLAETEIVKQKERIETQAEHLEEANKKLETLSIVARQTENAIMIMDAMGNLQWINEHFTKIYGYNFKQFTRLRGRNILETSFNPEIKKALEKCRIKKQAVTYEAENVTVSGNDIWTQTTLTPILNNNGDIKHLVTIDTDITKRKLAEAEINIQNTNITDSIKYASRIQNAIMPSAELLDTLFREYFILYQPKNIVSGDFYWAKKITTSNDELIVLVVADCTGHGVPGAFVSMLGISLIADIISSGFKKNGYITTNEILEKLRKRTKKTLNQKGSDGETKDGMDLALCIIDKKNKIFQYSGANNPLYHVKTTPDGNKQLDILHPTKNPIGIHHKEKDFEVQVIKYNTDDIIYLFSDGIIDQFGGENERKFMAKNFRNLLINIASKPMTQQKKEIENTLQKWKGNIEQIDDILVMGVKL